MRIVIFTSLDRNFSIDRYARELAANFPADVEVECVGLEKSPGLKGKIYDKHLRYLALARRQRADGYIIVSEGYAFLLRALDPRRALVVCHDVHPLIYRGPAPRGFWGWRYRANLRTLRRARFVVTVSEHTRKDLLKHCPFLAPEKVVAVHNGIETSWRMLDDSAALAAFRRQRGLEGRRFLLHVGNDNWYKNFSGLLRAVAARPDKELILVKVGEIGAENRRLISTLGLDARVVHVPSATSEELLLFYNAAAMLVFPSWHEGFGWPPLEAMACGCPVIAARKASLPEVCGDACLYVDPADTASIAAAIARLLNDSRLREELVQKGSRRPPLFSWKQTAREMLALLQEPPVLPERRSR